MTSRKWSEVVTWPAKTSRLPQQELQVHHCWTWILGLPTGLAATVAPGLKPCQDPELCHLLCLLSHCPALLGQCPLWHGAGRSFLEVMEALVQLVLAIDVFVLSKTWYIAHLLPLASTASGPVL
jgi:hypothetical protein